MKKLVIAVGIILCASNTTATESAKSDTKDLPRLHSIELMSLHITPSNEDCLILDLNGNKLNFPNDESSKLLLSGKVVFNKDCLSLDVRN